MLMIKTELGVSAKHDIGLFADQAIRKGDVIGLNNDDFEIIRYTEKQ